jgi:hypothetical protein
MGRTGKKEGGGKRTRVDQKVSSKPQTSTHVKPSPPQILKHLTPRLLHWRYRVIPQLCLLRRLEGFVGHRG